MTPDSSQKRPGSVYRRLRRISSCAAILLVLPTCDGDGLGPPYLTGPGTTGDPPVASAGGPYTAEEGAEIAFDGTGSSGEGEGELSYEWSFGDGTTGTGPEPTHTYEDDGAYTVVLTVTDPEGLTSKPDTTTATVSNVAPSVSLTLSTGSAMVGDSVSASGSFTDPGVLDAPWQWELDWGDGTKQTGSASSTSTTISGSWAYPAAGTYTVRLTVTDKDGGKGTAERTVSVAAPPKADAGGPYTGREGSAITFDGTASSGSGALSYAWSFGEGSTGTGTQPTHTYEDDGTYTVVLTVTDGSGVATKPDTTTATVSNVAPSVSLTLSAGSTLVGQSVSASGSFTDPGVLDAPWQWELDWGDGAKHTGSASSTSTAISGSRAYPAAGTYTVRLTVTDKDGGTGTAERTVSVAAPPKADAGGPYTGQEGSAVTFDGSGSSGSGGLSYAWSFGDGSTGTGTQPSHTYQDDGTYTVVLTVTDGNGVASKPDTTTATISNVAPSVSLTLSAGSVLVGETMSASGSFADPGALDAPWQWELDWGDGAKHTGSASSTSAGISGSRAYTAAGTYTVRLTVTDKDGGTGTAERTVSVAAPPKADAGGPYTGQEGSAVTFDGSASSGSGGLTYAWSFGDGSTGTGAAPAHTYQDDGTYTVILTVTDGSGVASKPDTTTATVSNVAPSVSLTLSAGSVLVGQSVGASGSFTDPGVNDAPWQWELDWGDGTKQTGSASSTSAGISGSRTYAAAGTYTVRLTVTDKDGDTGTAQQTVSVSAAGPTADFTFVTDNLEVTLTDASTSPGGNITSWTWTFGDGTVGTVRNPIRTYASPGTYTVRLTVRDEAGATSSRQRTVSVSGVATSKTVLIGAGDIAGCGVDRFGIPYQDAATAAILDRFPSATVFTAGDNVYPDATWEEHIECYEPTWGRHKARTRPSPGNHEYHTPNAWAYFEYFGAAAGDPSRGYYHYLLGGWLVIALNTNIAVNAGSPQEQWLRATLAANPRQCTLAYFHHPRFSTGRGDNFHVNVTALWQALYDYGADLVISAHDHSYERFAPRRPDGALDLQRGIRQITAGTGGGRLYPWGWSPSPYTQVRNNDTYGVIKLTLGSSSYTWEFIPVAGSSFTDSGRGSCR